MENRTASCPVGHTATVLGVGAQHGKLVFLDGRFVDDVFDLGIIFEKTHSPASGRPSLFAARISPICAERTPTNTLVNRNQWG